MHISADIWKIDPTFLELYRALKIQSEENLLHFFSDG